MISRMSSEPNVHTHIHRLLKKKRRSIKRKKKKSQAWETCYKFVIHLMHSGLLKDRIEIDFFFIVLCGVGGVLEHLYFLKEYSRPLVLN